MNAVTIHDAKTNLSKYIAAAKRGEKVYIGSFGKPEVMLILANASERPLKKRRLGVGKARLDVPDDAFSEAADAEIAKMFYEK